MQNKVVLVTAGAKRIGAAIVRCLHQAQVDIILHYRYSQTEAQLLSDELNDKRSGSVKLIQADLLDTQALPQLAQRVLGYFGQIDGIVNNASSFFATPLNEVDETHWHDLIGTNLKAPFFLIKALAPYLIEKKGAVVNIADIHAVQPMKEYSVYSIAKAGLVALTRSLALELAPYVRVNAVAPGANIWPEVNAAFTEEIKEQILSSIPLARIGTPEDIAGMVRFLLFESNYITGQVMNVDGGRSLVLG